MEESIFDVVIIMDGTPSKIFVRQWKKGGLSGPLAPLDWSRKSQSSFWVSSRGRVWILMVTLQEKSTDWFSSVLAWDIRICGVWYDWVRDRNFSSIWSSNWYMQEMGIKHKDYWYPKSREGTLHCTVPVSNEDTTGWGSNHLLRYEVCWHTIRWV